MEIKQLAHDEGLSENILLLLEAAGRVLIKTYYQGNTQSWADMALFHKFLQSNGDYSTRETIIIARARRASVNNGCFEG